ncbi:cryptic autophosphorylating protein tyrosine kinase Etk [Hartmannibacter diazotrophicus]|uniref:Cryptic autophosphorylating protein tyrosine kinase Etk n=1 Tax=Hartmannibacter diazotrophicus TaxID=1482074 RepID=A0A2C9DCK7_9HYPH|nr:exopolysaccharide transport family protein [Hartmannibacter diazotrophicus]SON57996.1 cryptic autophosphorylating protein tyrosine kinase Etk [Hartmannibacter diazotrophicus]
MNVPLTAEEIGWKSEGGNEPRKTSVDALVSLSDFFDSLLKSWWIVLAVLVIGVGSTFAYVKSVEPRFSPTSRIVVDMRQMLALATRLDPSIGIPKDSLLWTQVVLMRSEGNLLAVVDKLDLVNDPAFADVVGKADGKGSLLNRLSFGLLGRSGSQATSKPDDERLAVVRELQRYLDIRPITGTYVVNIEYLADDPVLGAEISNAVAEQYLKDQIFARYDATLRAEGWIERRLESLKDASSEAALAVEDYRQQHSLLEAGGRPLVEDDLKGMTLRVVKAGSDLAMAEATRDEAADLLKTGTLNSSTINSINDPNIVRLRRQYFDLQARIFELEQKAGEGTDSALADLRNQASTIEGQLRSSLVRIAAKADSDAKVAKTQLQNLQVLEEQTRRDFIIQQERSVRLRELERTARVMHEAYANFFAGYVQLTQRHAYPTSEARVLALASPPRRPSYPGKSLILMNAFAASLVVGSAIAVARQRSVSRLKAGDDVQVQVGCQCLAVLPRLPRRGAAARKALPTDEPDFIELTKDIGALVTSRMSGRGRGVVIAVTEGMPLGGGPALAEALAHSLTRRSEKVALIRAFVMPQSVKKEQWIGPEDAAGDAVKEFTLPMQMDQETTRQEYLERLIKSALEDYEIIVIDAPPLTHGADAGFVSQLADFTLLAVRWGAPYGPMLRDELEYQDGISSKLVGAVLYHAPRVPFAAGRRRIREWLFPRYGARSRGWSFSLR